MGKETENFTEDFTEQAEINDNEKQEAEQNEEQSEAANTENNELTELKDKLLRQMAETENIRRRSAKSVTEAREFAIFEFSRDLISVMDNFERSLEHLPKNPDQETKTIIEGLKMTKTELASVFEKHQLKTVKAATGDKFDYNLHNAISQIESDEIATDHIVKTVQQGYQIKDRLIRPATVIVAKNKQVTD